MQQNPDGSVTTHGAMADRTPTWGELQDHVASTGATLLPATPAQQPPPTAIPEEAASPAPAPMPAVAAALPSRVAPTTGAEPTVLNPPRSLASHFIPSASAATGAWALPATAAMLTAPVGPLSWPAIAGLSILGAYGGGYTGEYGQAQLERGLYGEPPPGSPTPSERAAQFGKTAADTEVVVQGATPLVAPIIRGVTKAFGSTAVTSASEAGPLLRTGALGEDAAIRGGQDVAADVARTIEGGHARTSMEVGSAAPGVTVNTDGLAPLVSQTRVALERQGATPEQLALFDRNMTPVTQGGPQPLQSVLGAERNMNRWAASTPPQLQLPDLHVLGTQTRNAITTGVADTPAAQPWQNYLAGQAETAATRSTLHQAASGSPIEFHPWLHAEGGPALEAIVRQAAPEDAKAVGQAWLASVRQGARTAVDPTKYVADAYEALPVASRKALFGEQTPALANLIGAATTVGPAGLKLPLVGTVPIARPWAQSVLMSPRAAAATSTVQPLLSGAGRTGLYSAAAQSEEPRPGP